MAKINRLAALRKAIASMGEIKTERRYDDRLTEQIVAYARSRQAAGESQQSIARELDVSPPTLSRMLRRSSKLIPVKVLPDSKASRSRSTGYLVRGPGGTVIEGLTLAEVAELLARIGSCSV